MKSINQKRNQIDTLHSTQAFQRTKDPDDKKRQQVDNNCQPHRQTQKGQKTREGKSKELKPSGQRTNKGRKLMSERLNKHMSKKNTQINELIKKAKVQGLSDDITLNIEVRRAINNADKERRHLSQDEIRKICKISGTSTSEISLIQAKSTDLVTASRKGLLEEQPDLIKPGGALYPTERAEACWSDCWQFLRVINYAYACNKTKFTSPKGMTALRELYKKMGVPISGLSTALRYLEILTIEEVGTAKGKAQLTNIFEHLMQELNIAAVKT